MCTESFGEAPRGRKFDTTLERVDFKKSSTVVVLNLKICNSLRAACQYRKGIVMAISLTTAHIRLSGASRRYLADGRRSLTISGIPRARWLSVGRARRRIMVKLDVPHGTVEYPMVWIQACASRLVTNTAVHCRMAACAKTSRKVCLSSSGGSARLAGFAVDQAQEPGHLSDYFAEEVWSMDFRCTAVFTTVGGKSTANCVPVVLRINTVEQSSSGDDTRSSL